MVNRLDNAAWQQRVQLVPGSRRPHSPKIVGIVVILLIAGAQGLPSFAQAGGHKLFGDLRVDESKASGPLPLSYDILLYCRSGNALQRVAIPNRGRYQFLGLADGDYFVVVEIENRTIARIRVSVNSPFKTDFRQDIELEWHSAFQTEKAATVSAADFYKRSAANGKLFVQAQKAANEKKYDQAIGSLTEILKDDPQDFQAWTELGTAYLARPAWDLAEKCYVIAIQTRPGFFLANLDLGRLYSMEKKFGNAINPLRVAVKINPQSTEANYFLGEAYLQARQGSLAVTYLNEALRLDPQGMADVHLRLALLYNAAQMKDKAAHEYQEFLKKRPDYRERKKLEKYIADNKKP